MEFVHRFLIPEVLLRFGQTEVGGAFVLDTLLNRNTSLGIALLHRLLRLPHNHHHKNTRVLYIP